MKKLRRTGYLTMTAALAALAFGGEAAAQQANFEVGGNETYRATDFTAAERVLGDLALVIRDRDFRVENLAGEVLEPHANFINLAHPVPGLEGYVSALVQAKDLKDPRYGINVKAKKGPVSGYVLGTSSFQGWDPIVNSKIAANIPLGSSFDLRASLEDFDDNGIRSNLKVDRQELELEVTYKGFGLGVGVHDWNIRKSDALMETVDVVRTREPVLTFGYSTGPG